LILFV